MSRNFKTVTSAGSSAPFVRWTRPGAVEGVVLEEWSGDFGPVLRMRVEAAYGGDDGLEDVIAVTGSGATKAEVPVRPGDIVNVGLSAAGLAHLAGTPAGYAVRIEFLAWGETKSGKPFRKFVTGLEAPEADA